MVGKLRRHPSLTAELLDHHGSINEGTRRQLLTELLPSLSLTTLTSALESPVSNLTLFPQAKLPETIVLIHPATTTGSTLINQGFQLASPEFGILVEPTRLATNRIIKRAMDGFHQRGGQTFNIGGWTTRVRT
jgi:hypothetical protein